MKNISVLFVSIALGLFLCETGLRLFTPFPISEESNKSEDPVLGYRLSPHLDDVDQYGFRNPEYKESYDIAALGDSHTYGENVSSDQTWPALLEKKTGMKVYNFGVGGYGILTYHAILKTLVNPDTESVIIGLYPANDFEKRYSFCHINSAESVFWQNEIKALDLKLLAAGSYLKECKKKPGRNSLSRLKKQVFDYSAMVSAIEILLIKPLEQYLRHIRNDHYKYYDNHKYYIFPDRIHPVSKARTKYFTKMTDLQNPDINSMYENLGKFADSWTKWAHDNNTKIGVLIIPSMERVVYEYFNRKNELHLLDADFIRALEVQIQFEKSLAGLFYAHNVPYRFALNNTVDAFSKSLQEGEEFYPIDNGHPYEEGYQAYARAAYELWEIMNNDK